MAGLPWCQAALWCALLPQPEAEPRPAEGPRPASYTTEQLLRGLGEAHAKVRAWSVEYQAASHDLPFYTHRTLAAAFPDSCLYRGAKGPTGFDWQSDVIDPAWKDDAFRDWVLVTPGFCYWGVPHNREFGEFPMPRDAPLPSKVNGELMFLALGWWPFEKRPGPALARGDSFVTPAVVRSGKYAVAPRQERCDGRWCHVLEYPGHDKLWVDAGHNFAFAAREVFDAASGSLAQRLELSEHREEKPGVWVPRVIRNIHFDYRAPTPEGRRRRTMEARVRIAAVRLNDDVDGRTFQPGPKPPGALLVRDNGRYDQVVPGGYDHMDDLADWLLRAERYAGARPVGKRPAAPRPWPWAAARDYAIMGAAAGVLLVLKFWRPGCGRGPRGRRRGPTALP